MHKSCNRSCNLGNESCNVEYGDSIRAAGSQRLEFPSLESGYAWQRKMLLHATRHSRPVLLVDARSSRTKWIQALANQKSTQLCSDIKTLRFGPSHSGAELYTQERVSFAPDHWVLRLHVGVVGYDLFHVRLLVRLPFADSSGPSFGKLSI